MTFGLSSVFRGLSLALALTATAHAAELESLVVAEPVHSTGYLPLYVAIHKGFFAQEGLALKVVTIESGSGHTNAVLSGQAFAFIGGPEHNAYAKLKGAELRTVVNVVDRGNVYLVAKKGMAPAGQDMSAFLKGKAIATGAVGGTPNSITRFLMDKWKIDSKKDVELLETTAAGGLAAVKAGRAQVIVAAEPQITQGIRQGLFEEPFYNVPRELGPYAYSTLNVRLESITKQPETVAKFVRAVMKGLQATYANPAEAAEIARKEFPTMPPEDLKATIDRSFKDEIWSRDGLVSQQAWTTSKSVVMDAGMLKQDVPYAGVIDMQFVQKNVAVK
jgi:NitT/TauT family transport system substrate-binding protein